MIVDKKLIGAKIKECRKKKNLSQFELAELVGLSDKHIGRIEAGKYCPNYVNFLNILEAVGLDLDFLFKRKKSEPRIEPCNIEELMELIYNSTPKEINLYLKLIETYKKNK